MTGGLMQISNYGSQDIFLTGNPKFSFYKQVYRQHTNFSIETIEHGFLDSIDFGGESVAVINKLGDLMSRIYLVIDLPQVDLALDRSEIREQALNHALIKIIKDYLSENDRVIRSIYNITDIDIIAKTVQNDNRLTYARKQALFAIRDSPDLISDLYLSDVETLVMYWIRTLSYVPEKILSRLRLLLEKEIPTMEAVLFQKIIASPKVRQRHDFAWIEEIGHQIIDSYDIQIGSETIDTQTGDWLICYNQLTLDQKRENYDKMIGNIDSLTTFDDTIKQPYRLIIPLQFWFNRHLGQSLPLISLRQDISINLRLKDLDQITVINPDLDIDNLRSQYDINIKDAKLWIDYVFLDSIERERFAKYTHEYLIETVQFTQVDGIVGPDHVAHIRFNHPTKYIIWYYLPTRSNKLFGGNTTDTSWIRINTQYISDKSLDSHYYNYLQPYLYFQNSVQEGLNLYSFCLYPKVNQPSGSINLSRLDGFSIGSVFTKEILDEIDCSNDTLQMKVFAMSYNILRIVGGVGNVAFSRS